MCFDATSSFVAGGAAYGVSAYLLRRNHARLKWGAVALMGITMMQWVEGFLWLDGPLPHGTVNKILTVALIPIALLAQAWGPLLGSAWEVPISKRKSAFYGLMTVGLLFVVIARVVHHPTMTQVTPEGFLNWWSPQNPPTFPVWAYGLWALVIGSPFLIWWKPMWQALLICSWGWFWATLSFLVTDSAASYWCFFVSFYAIFVFIYALMTPDSPPRDAGAMEESEAT